MLNLDLYHLTPGLKYRVHGREEPVISHSHLQSNVSDLPASRKISGTAGHTSKDFMCPYCDMKFFRLVDPSCYEPLGECYVDCYIN